MPKKKVNDDRSSFDVAAQRRLNEAREAGIPWKKWGPYLSERQWVALIGASVLVVVPTDNTTLND